MGKDINKELEKIIAQLEKLGQENNFTLYADAEKVEKLQYILENIFCR